MSWIEKNYKTRSIKNIPKRCRMLLTGRNVLTSPEGYGKSTVVLKECLDNPLGHPVIFTSHTIDNAIEKYEYAEKWTNKSAANMYLIHSDSELFRQMIKPQSEVLYHFFKKAINQSNHKYLRYQTYSCKHGQLKTIGKSPSIMRKFGAWGLNPTPVSYNSICLGDMYNSINSVYGQLNYYIVFNIGETPNTSNPLPLTVNLQALLEEHSYDIVAVRTVLERHGLSVVCITSTAIKNWRGLRKQRDENLKQILTDPNAIILCQNKVTEEVIIPILEKDDINSSLIVDEFTHDCFWSIGQRDIDRLTIIIKKGFKYGYDALAQDDIFFLKDLGVYDKVQEICETKDGEISLGNINLDITPEGDALVHAGDIRLAKRLTSCSNTLILTTEVVPSTIMQTYYGYTIFEAMKGYKFKDRKLKFYPTGNNDPVCTTKGSKDTVVKFLDMFRETTNRKDETLCIGTSYFDVDITLEACKGRNFSDGIKNVCIVKNPDPFTKTGNVVSLIKQNEPTVNRKELFADIREYSLIDLLNQVIGRFSGFRRGRYPNVNMDFLYYHHDELLKSALNKLRYKGLTCKINNKLIYLKDNFNTINIRFSRLSHMVNVYKDSDYLTKVYNSPLFSLSDIFKNSEYTKRGITNNLVVDTICNSNKQTIDLLIKYYIKYSKDAGNHTSYVPLYELDLLDKSLLSIPDPLLLLKYTFWSNYYGENSYRFKRMSNNTNYLLTTLHKPINLIDNNIIKYIDLIYKNITWYIAYTLGQVKNTTQNLIDTGMHIVESFPYIDRGIRLLQQGMIDKSFNDKIGNRRYNDVLHFIRGIAEEFNNPLKLKVFTTNDDSFPCKLRHIQLPQVVECGFT